jgi:hypothetical protein
MTLLPTNKIRVIKSRTIRRTGQVVRPSHGTDQKCMQSFGSKTERGQLEDLGVDTRITTKLISEKQEGRMWS